MSIFTIEQQAVVSAADAVSRSDASLKQSIAELIGEKLKAGMLATIPDADQDALVSELLTLVRTAADGETVWSVKDCRNAKPGTIMHKAGQRYEAISKAYNRMKPKAEKVKADTKAKAETKAEAKAEAEADPKKPGKVVVLPVKAALVALKEAASKPVGKKK